MANPEDPNMRHISVAGGTYTIRDRRTDGGRYSLIDMLVPPGGGPPLHRHDFEEMFTILEGEIELTFRGERNERAPVRPLISRKRASLVQEQVESAGNAFSACARQRGRRSSSWRSATRVGSRTAPPPQLSRKSKRSAYNEQSHSRPSIEQSC